MHAAIAELGRLVAEAAVVELAQRSFGAVETVEFTDGQEFVTGDEAHWVLTWAVESAGFADDVKLVFLPEFLDTEPELLVSQFAALLVEKALAGEAEGEDEGDG